MALQHERKRRVCVHCAPTTAEQAHRPTPYPNQHQTTHRFLLRDSHNKRKYLGHPGVRLRPAAAGARTSRERPPHQDNAHAHPSCCCLFGCSCPCRCRHRLRNRLDFTTSNSTFLSLTTRQSGNSATTPLFRHPWPQATGSSSTSRPPAMTVWPAWNRSSAKFRKTRNLR